MPKKGSIDKEIGGTRISASSLGAAAKVSSRDNAENTMNGFGLEFCAARRQNTDRDEGRGNRVNLDI